MVVSYQVNIGLWLCCTGIYRTLLYQLRIGFGGGLFSGKYNDVLVTMALFPYHIHYQSVKVMNKMMHWIYWYFLLIQTVSWCWIHCSTIDFLCCHGEMFHLSDCNSLAWEFSSLRCFSCSVTSYFSLSILAFLCYFRRLGVNSEMRLDQNMGYFDVKNLKWKVGYKLFVQLLCYRFGYTDCCIGLPATVQ